MEKQEIDVQENLLLIRGEYREKFEAFRAYLLEFNGRYNLTAITEEKDVLYKHFVDSAAARGLFSNGASVAEIGSGAGFPSVPLKILREDLSFTLFESVGKKCDFLRFIVDKLDFKEMHICNMRAEDAAGEEKYREKFDYAVARAVARMNILSEYCLPLVKKGGEFIAYKSADVSEIYEAKHAEKELGGSRRVSVFAAGRLWRTMPCRGEKNQADAGEISARKRQRTQAASLKNGYGKQRKTTENFASRA